MTLPGTWASAIKKSIDLSKNLKAPVLFLNPVEVFKPVVEDVFSYFIPSLVICDPIKTVDYDSVLCLEHMSTLSQTNLWLDGDNNSKMPRILIDITGPMFLIGRIYNFQMGNHCIRTTDADILKQCGESGADIVCTQICS